MDYYAGLITSTDIFSTIAELAGIDKSEINDSKSFKSLLIEHTIHRAFQYSEMNNGMKDQWTISNGEYKVIESASGEIEMYHLENDPNENNNLLTGMLNSTAESAKIELKLALSEIRN